MMGALNYLRKGYLNMILNGSKRTGLYFAAAAAACALFLGGCHRDAVPTEKTKAGFAAVESQNYQEAEGFFTEAVSDGEDPVAAYRGLGIAQMGQAKYAEASDSFGKALAATDDKMPETVLDLLQYRASSQYRMQDYEGAIETCSQITAADPQQVMAYFYTGASQLHLGNQEEAEANFDYAASLRPDDYQLYLDIYSVYEDTKLSGVGDTYLQTALGIAPENNEDYYNVGKIYYYLEQYDQASEALNQPVKDGHEPALSLMGRIYLAKGENDNANAIYSQILQKNQKDADAYNGLALCALAQDDPDKALNYITQGLELPGGEGKQELYFNEIIAYEKKLDFLTARDKCRTYVEMYPTDEEGAKELEFLNTRG